MDDRKRIEGMPLAIERDAALPALVGMAGIALVAVAAASLMPLVLGS